MPSNGKDFVSVNTVRGVRKVKVPLDVVELDLMQAIGHSI
jgi:hypothetical protein